MYVDEKKQGEIQQAPAKVLKPSAAIREGAKLIAEHRTWYMKEDCGCALGTMARGYGMPSPVYSKQPMIDFIRSKYPAISQKTLETAEGHHVTLRMDRLQIADWLEGQGL